MADAMSPDEIRALTSYSLAGMANCQGPDAIDSPGADYLDSVRIAVLEAFDYHRNDVPNLMDHCSDVAGEVLTVYTHPRWLVFVDLCAYQEDVSDLGPLEDMETAAVWANAQIGDRLVSELVDSLTAWVDEQEEATDDDDSAPIGSAEPLLTTGD